MEGDWDPDLDQELLHIGRARAGTAAVLTASGEIDLSTAPHLRAALSDVLEESESGEPPPRTVVLDLTGVTFLGSTGLAVLVDANSEAAAHQVVLAVVVDRRGGPVARALQAAAIDQHLTTYPDVDSALQDATSRS